MLNREKIWRSLIEVTPQGDLRWKKSKLRESSVIDDRLRCLFPETMIYFSEDVHPDPTELVQTGDNEYTAENGVITGLRGLLDMKDLLPVRIRHPKETLLVGAISPKSLGFLLNWLKKQGWQSSHVTLVDRSPVVIETTRRFLGKEEFTWSAGIDVLCTDITVYGYRRKADLIVADILNITNVDSHSYPQIDGRFPYEQYDAVLHAMKKSSSVRGCILSRCLVQPEGRSMQPGHLTQEDDRVGKVLWQLGSLADKVDKERLSEGLEVLFEDRGPISFCGLEKYHPEFQPGKTPDG